MEAVMPDKRIALVTGGNRGMGFDVVRQLAARGMMVLLGSRDEKMGKDARAQLPTSDQERIAVYSFDVADAKRTAQAIRDIERQHGPVDVLVNNAGVYPDADAPGLEIDPA